MAGTTSIRLSTITGTPGAAHSNHDAQRCGTTARSAVDAVSRIAAARPAGASVSNPSGPASVGDGRQAG